MDNEVICAHSKNVISEFDKKGFIIARCSECKSILSVFNKPQFTDGQVMAIFRDLLEIKNALIRIDSRTAK